MMRKKFSGSWFSKNRLSRMMGRSVISGAKETGIPRRHPPDKVSVMRYVWNGPGEIAAVKPSAAPWRKYVNGLGSTMSISSETMFIGRL
jgi:hypothetical protein